MVIAAGPQTGLFADMLGVSLPLAPARVEMIATEPLPLMRHGGVAGNGLYGRQTLRGNLVYGGGPHEWINVPDMATPDHPNTPARAKPRAPAGRAVARAPPTCA